MVRVVRSGPEGRLMALPGYRLPNGAPAVIRIAPNSGTILFGNAAATAIVDGESSTSSSSSDVECGADDHNLYPCPKAKPHECDPYAHPRPAAIISRLAASQSRKARLKAEEVKGVVGQSADNLLSNVFMRIKSDAFRKFCPGSGGIMCGPCLLESRRVDSERRPCWFGKPDVTAFLVAKVIKQQFS